MKLSVVILNYNVRYFLEQCIRSVQRATSGIDSEIIVIDNASSDDSCTMVKELFPQILLIENEENVGFSTANNQAVSRARGEYICILNPDTAVAEDTFISCFRYADTLNNMGILGLYFMDGTGNFLPESKRNVPTPKASILKLIGGGGNYYANHIEPTGTGEIDVLAGAFMFLKKSIYEEVGGFDEAYFMYGEDIDFSYKILKKGYQNYYLGSAAILHYKGESTQKDSAYYDRFYGAMNIFYKKHFKTNALFDLSVNLGVSFIKLFKKAKYSPKQINTSTKAYVFTENLSFLKALSENIDIPLKSASKAVFMEDSFSDALLIFDAEYMQYSQIFKIMNRFKNNNNQFRIHPPNTRFILGSDQSDEKGTAIVF